MTSASMSFGRPGRLTIPRGSLWLGSFAAWLIAVLRRLDQRELSRRREPQTADEVMAWASSMESTQPGFASDLRSAALRSMSQRDR